VIAIRMKNFLHSHPNIVIGTLAAVFVLLLAAFYSWAIGDVFNQMSRALASASAQSAPGFDLPGASRLDLRGLVNGVAPAPTATTSVSAPSSSTSTP
jgi:hypothetical protein